MAFTASCKKLDSRDIFAIYGSRESNGELVAPSGTVYKPVLGKDRIPSLTGQERSRMRMYYYLSETSTKGVGDKQDIDVIQFEYLTTQLPSMMGSAEKNDPLLLPSLETEIYSTSDIFTMKPGIVTTLNYLDMIVWHLRYKANATGDDEYAEISTTLEIDPNITPGVGETPDVITMYLRFDNNRGPNETLENAYGPFVNWRSFDLTHVPESYGFPVKDEAGNNITYIIKMWYKTYENLANAKDSEIVDKFVTTEWTPGNPYKE